MLIAVFCFSLMNVLVKEVKSIPAAEVVFFRSLVSFAVTFFMLKKAKIPLFGTNKKILIARGVFGAVALTLYFETLQELPLATAISLHYLSPIFTAVIASVVLGEKLRKLQWVFFAVSFAGVVIVKGFDTRVNMLYFSMAVAGAFLAGAAYNCIRKLKTSENALVVVFYFPLIAMPVTGLYSAFNWVMPSGIEWLWLLLIGLLTQAAQVLMTKAYQIEQASRVAGVTYTGIVYAFLFGFFIFGEVYHFESFLGIAVVLLGVILNIFYKNRYDAKA